MVSEDLVPFRVKGLGWRLPKASTEARGGGGIKG